MATPAQRPNCPWLKCSKCPIAGKTYRATALSRKIEPIDTAISDSVAPMTELTAAMAEPPQMAVPAEISAEVLPSSFNLRPSQKPRTKVAQMVVAANSEPFKPRRSTTCKFMPKPSRMTQICRSHLVIL